EIGGLNVWETGFLFHGCFDQIKLVYLPVITQRHYGAGNKVRRTKVTAHRVEGDLHRCETLRTLVAECKVKMRRPPASAALRRARQGDGYSYLPSSVNTCRPR